MDRKTMEETEPGGRSGPFDTIPLLEGSTSSWRTLETEWIRGGQHTRLHDRSHLSTPSWNGCFMMTAAVTALGTRLFGAMAKGATATRKA